MVNRASATATRIRTVPNSISAICPESSNGPHSECLDHPAFCHVVRQRRIVKDRLLLVG